MRRPVRTSLVLLVALLIFIAMGTAVYAGVHLYPSPADAGFFGGDNDFDFDPPSGGVSGGDGGFDFIPGVSTGGGSSFGVIIVVIIIIFFILKARKGGQSQPASVAAIPPEQSTAVADQIRALDPFFTEAEMREKVSNLYSEMQRAWETQDWEPMRARLTDDLYSQMARQLQELITRGQINRIERIAIMNVALKSFYQDEQHDNLGLRLTTRITDYTIDRKTGNVVNGDPKREKFMTYEWTMIRSKGVLTVAPDASGKQEVSRNCPHCGAPIDLTQSARCSYCFSIVKATEFDWVLSNIKGISQQTI
ncbi:MAG TPA: TIM44-like domain-containing protein [Clostridia bacterium]|nr:TIM44-like domain-containing protein [Clostridia bacterium]